MVILGSAIELWIYLHPRDIIKCPVSCCPEMATPRSAINTSSCWLLPFFLQAAAAKTWRHSYYTVLRYVTNTRPGRGMSMWQPENDSSELWWRMGEDECGFCARPRSLEPAVPRTAPDTPPRRGSPFSLWYVSCPVNPRANDTNLFISLPPTIQFNSDAFISHLFSLSRKIRVLPKSKTLQFYLFYVIVKTCSPFLLQEYRMRMFENRMQRRILCLRLRKNKENIHNYNLQDL
jgi:hypothetical protein